MFFPNKTTRRKPRIPASVFFRRCISLCVDIAPCMEAWKLLLSLFLSPGVHNCVYPFLRIYLCWVICYRSFDSFRLCVYIFLLCSRPHSDLCFTQGQLKTHIAHKRYVKYGVLVASPVWLSRAQLFCLYHSWIRDYLDLVINSNR